jgi:aromatic ring-opening dioxygenase catalytic subunit (LigB family)
LGNPELANTINTLLKEHGIASKLDDKRGFDHGTFVPLMLMYPLADIPVIQLSLISSLDPYKHIAIGRALESLREQGVLILGSGMSFHNMSAFFSGDSSTQNKSKVFDTWLSETLMSNELNFSDQTTRLIKWTHAPEARFCHPREEHLLPLHVCFGAGAKPSVRATKVFGGSLYNTTISAYLWN